MRQMCLLLFAVAGVILPAAAEEPEYVFKSEVSLVRVDAQVVDRNNRAITGLNKEDFVILENGKAQEIRHFESEEMPVDVVLLLDVSSSMRPHVERLARAAHQALAVLAERDRVAIMVFDRQSRVRMPFRSGYEDIENGLENVLRQETFDGGTDITRALLDAAAFIGRDGRREARRAIVILTDDQTEFNRDEESVLRALDRSNAVLSALLAPDALGSGRTRTTSGGGIGSSWPTIDPWGGIILGRRGPYGGRGPVVISRPRTRSAGTSEIALETGGDSMRVDEAAAFETTLTRLRQRYALHFNLPDGVKPGQEGRIEVVLASNARRQYPDSQVRYRRLSQMGESNEPVLTGRNSRSSTRNAPPVAPRNEEPEPPSGGSSPGGWRRISEPMREPGPLQAAREPSVLDPEDPPATVKKAEPAAPPKENPGGWRRVKPGEKP